MKKNPFKISKFIYKFLTGQLSKKDEHVLQNWLEEKESHKDLLSEFEQSERLKDDFEVFRNVDTAQDWSEFKKRIADKPKKIFGFPRLRVAVAAGLVFLLTGIAYLFVFVRTVDQKTIYVEKKINKDIAPAKSGAQLILADGSTMVLGDGVQETAEGNGYKIQKSGDGIRYSNTDHTHTVIGTNTLIVPKGEYYNITLPDGTKVWVNAMSKLRFPERFSSSERKVELEGEAYFEVVRDEQRSFIVVANQVNVHVLGTAFNVNAYNLKSIRTSLVEGSVKIQSETGDTRFLKPGDRADFTRGTLSVKKADLKREIAWQNGEFYFKKDNIVYIMNEINRWYNVDVTFASDVDFESEYFGNVSRHEPLSKVLDALSFVGELAFSIEENKVMVRNKKK